MTITDERALELLREHFAEPNCWDWAYEYGEPGYSFDGDQQILVIGYYWCRCDKIDGLHDMGAHHPRLWARFGEVAEFSWNDEWIIDHENGSKAYRTGPDSYGWTPAYAITEYGDIITPDDDVDVWLEYAVDQRRALYRTQLHESALTEAGFERYPDDDTFYESGWHPGQTDDPAVILDAANAAGLDAIVYVTSQGQFDTRWVVYTRPRQEDADG
jgi:hypothetical protein